MRKSKSNPAPGDDDGPTDAQCDMMMFLHDLEITQFLAIMMQKRVLASNLGRCAIHTLRANWGYDDGFDALIDMQIGG